MATYLLFQFVKTESVYLHSLVTDIIQFNSSQIVAKFVPLSCSCEYQNACFHWSFLNVSLFFFLRICNSSLFYVRLFSMCTTKSVWLFCFMKICHVFWWLCLVGFSICGFLIFLNFKCAIIVCFSVDMHVWFCKNLTWYILCVFFLQVIKCLVWYFSNCF